jgi:hypothetical protein
LLLANNPIKELNLIITPIHCKATYFYIAENLDNVMQENDEGSRYKQDTKVK